MRDVEWALVLSIAIMWIGFAVVMAVAVWLD